MIICFMVILVERLCFFLVNKKSSSCLISCNIQDEAIELQIIGNRYTFKLLMELRCYNFISLYFTGKLQTAIVRVSSKPKCFFLCFAT